ncbi:hypothetical protein L1887_50151 [Cichorium endivia]|nr:hypothetical protein L1887_50151 [Cichorium endivia]
MNAVRLFTLRRHRRSAASPQKAPHSNFQSHPSSLSKQRVCRAGSSDAIVNPKRFLHPFASFAQMQSDIPLTGTNGITTLSHPHASGRDEKRVMIQPQHHRLASTQGGAGRDKSNATHACQMQAELSKAWQQCAKESGTSQNMQNDRGTERACG